MVTPRTPVRGSDAPPSLLPTLDAHAADSSRPTPTKILGENLLHSLGSVNLTQDRLHQEELVGRNKAGVSQGGEQEQQEGGDGGGGEAEDGGADPRAEPGGAGGGQARGEAECGGGGEASISSPRGFAPRGGSHPVGGNIEV